LSFSAAAQRWPAFNAAANWQPAALQRVAHGGTHLPAQSRHTLQNPAGSRIDLR
jgi:hypothetical protein